MTTSGTTTFNMPIDEIIQKAYERLGGEHITGYDAITARQTLNLLMIDLQNRNIPLGNVKEHRLTLVQGQNEYELPVTVIDLLDAYLQRVQGTQVSDYEMIRESLFEYNDITNKSTESRPTRFVIHKQRDNPLLYLYPTPPNSTDVFVYWSMDRVEDITASNQTIDLSIRYQSAVIAGLAYELAFQTAQIPDQRLALLKADFEEKLLNANNEDRERTDYVIVPKLGRY